MEYLGTIYKGSQSDIIFPVPFIELSDGATVDFYTDGDGGFSRTKDEIKIDNYMLRTTASADELNSLNDGVLNYTINTCMGKSEGDTGLYLSEPTSYVDKQYLTADGVKTINGESIVGQGNIEIQGGGSEDYIWIWSDLTQTGATTYTDDEINKAISAFENGQRIIIAYKDLYIYPNFTNTHKGYLEIEYSYKGLNYRFRYNGSNLQFNNIINDGYTYVWEWYRGDVPSLNNISTKFSINDVKSVMEAYDSGKKIEITYVGRTKMPVYAINRGTNQIALYFASDYTYNYSWYCTLSDDGSSIINQHLNKFETQQQLTSSSYPYVKNIDLLTNRNVDSILTNLKSSATTADNNINELSGNVKTVQAKDIEQDKRIDTIESYAKESLGNLEALSGSVQNNYYTKTQCDKQYEVIGYSYSKKEVDGKIPTSTSQLTNDSGYLTEHQSLEEYYTKSETYSKGESDGKYALKTDTYTKAESDTNYASKTDTYTKAEIDTKIGDINNILESI